jgi:hypothetical protein
MLRHRKKHNAASVLCTSSTTSTEDIFLVSGDEDHHCRSKLYTSGTPAMRDEVRDDNSDLIEYLLEIRGSIFDNILQSKLPADEAARPLGVHNEENKSL